MTDNRPKIGVGVFVWKDGKFLMGKRLGSHGAQTWSIPGGHLEFGESWEACAKREVLEEAGIVIENVRFLAATNDLFPADKKHYVTIWVECDWKSGEPTLTEPDTWVDSA
ncbi:MAG: NUDIX domain-containing protein, partial [Candidatus Saccharimonadales bacterium]